MIIEGITLIFISLVMVMIPVFGQWNLYTIIDDSKFKRIKLKKIKFFFKAIDFQPVDKHGIIIPIFIMQITSYLLSIFTLIFGFINILNKNNPLIISVLILLIEIIVFLILIIILSIISRKKKRIN